MARQMHLTLINTTLVFSKKNDGVARTNMTRVRQNKNLAHAGLEPATFALLARRSNQLS